MNPIHTLKSLNPVSLVSKGIDKSMQLIVMSLIRHGLTSLGTFLVTCGYLSSTQSEAMSGAVITLIGLGMAVVDKIARTKLAKA